MILFAKSAVLMFYLVLVAGNNHLLFDKLIRCIGDPATSVRDALTETHFCMLSCCKQCFQDDHPYTTKPSHRSGFCGCIDSQRITTPRRFTWWIRTTQTVWLNFILFQLHLDHFPCYDEYMILVESDDVKNIFCGRRVPWYYYGQTSAVFLDFFSNHVLFKTYAFKIYFQEGKQLQFKEIKIEVRYTSVFTRLDFKHRNYNFITMHILAERWRFISLQIDNNCTFISSKVYDGPGVKSPQLRSGETSTAFIVLLRMQQSTMDPYCLSGFRFEYMTNYHAGSVQNTYQCIWRNARDYGYANVTELTLPPRHQNQRCMLWLDHKPQTRLGIKSFSFNGPNALLDNEECLYGGLFLYLRKNGAYNHLWSSCNSYNELKDTPIFVTMAQIVIVVVQFKHYSRIIHFGAETMHVENNQISYVQTEKSPNNEHLINIPEFLKYYSVGQKPSHNNTMWVQSLKDKAESRELKFGVRSISASISCVSTMCNTPIYGCSCITFNISYSQNNIISYYIPEVNHLEGSSIVDLIQNPFLSFVESLILNQTGCHPYKKSMWLLQLSSIYSAIDTADMSIEFPLTDSEYQYPIMLSTHNVVHTPAWFLFHFVEDNNHKMSEQFQPFVDIDFKAILFSNNHRETDTTHITLEVEFVQQNGEALVFEGVEGQVSTSDSHFVLECITCNPCNVIIRYRSPVNYCRPFRAPPCIDYNGDYFMLTVRKFILPQKSFMSSVRHTNMSFISHR